MTDRERYALELQLMHDIEKRKFSFRKLLKIFELSAIAENR